MMRRRMRSQQCSRRKLQYCNFEESQNVGSEVFFLPSQNLRSDDACKRPRVAFVRIKWRKPTSNVNDQLRTALIITVIFRGRKEIAGGGRATNFPHFGRGPETE